jgi:hypothetical protein
MPRRNRTMKGGFFNTLSNWGSSLWRKATSTSTSSLSGSTTPTQSYGQPQTYEQPQSYGQSPSYTQQMGRSTYGGKISRKHSRRMRGGFKDNTPTTGLAAHAASFSGVTAKPHTLVGGKTRKNRKSRRHRR